MMVSDIVGAVKFWKEIEGLGPTKADSPEDLSYHLIRNPNLNFVAVAEDQLIGTVLGGFDGRRGYVYHLAVDKNYRKKDVAKKLMNLCFESFRKMNVEKCHMLVFKDNYGAHDFYKKIGCKLREDVVLFTKEFK